MKFINYLESITGVSIYPLSAQIIFIVVFAVAIYLAMRTSKESIKKYKNLPFE
ncbi:MAG: CcoQ/FixQ family Cbb3-type cytochrome c oxidase assembly chaperone [Flavobacteriales bacterium]|nr:CcoQ/FixQ family Cbb3-type cytochrome c oxidase assembly chaperone [Flavobacteriales bacterium]